MVEKTIQVQEWMADFIAWVNARGYNETKKMICERLAEIKEQNQKSKGSHIDEGFKWDEALEPNDDVNQWEHGGDCNMCRKANYCQTKCRANKLLKKITTPMLYQWYLDENPDAAAKNPNGVDTESIMRQIGEIQ